LSAAAKEVALKNQVKNFVERFGSYSKDADYANFEELQPIITASVAQWLKTYPKTLKEKEPAGFVGVSTFVVSQKITKSDAISAEVLVSVQREETTTAGVNRYYKDILVKLILVGDTWKVDGAYWQP
jgi:translation initiation factor 2 gamma subunit (eIF-2gamma)